MSEENKAFIAGLALAAIFGIIACFITYGVMSSEATSAYIKGYREGNCAGQGKFPVNIDGEVVCFTKNAVSP